MSYFVFFLVVVLTFLVGLGSSGFGLPLTDLLSSFFWHFAAGASILAVAAVISRSKMATVAAVCLVLYSGYNAYDYPALDPQPLNSEPQNVFTVLTFNSWALVENEQQILTYLRETKPDFVAIQEIDTTKFKFFETLRDIYKYMHHCSGPLCRMVFLSKRPWLTIKSGKTGPGKLPLVDIVYGQENFDLRLVFVHAARPSLNFSTQRIQMEWLGDRLSGLVNPLVVGGDFNSPVFSAPVASFMMRSGLKSAAPYLTSWPQRTRHLRFIKLPFTQFGLDQFFVNQKVRLISKKRGPDLGSDHRPIILEFSLK